MIGVGYCAQLLADIASKDKDKKVGGDIIFAIMFVAAIGLFILSLAQGNVLSDVMNRLLP
jgi:hypothetical protein